MFELEQTVGEWRKVLEGGDPCVFPKAALWPSSLEKFLNLLYGIVTCLSPTTGVLEIVCEQWTLCILRLCRPVVGVTQELQVRKPEKGLPLTP